MEGHKEVPRAESDSSNENKTEGVGSVLLELKVADVEMESTKLIPEER